MIQTNPDGTPAPPAPKPTRPGLLLRLKLTEPARMYLYGLATTVVTAFVIAGAITGQWVGFTYAAVGVVLGLGGAAEAIRASVYSPATMAGLLLASRGRHTVTIPTPEKDAAI